MSTNESTLAENIGRAVLAAIQDFPAATATAMATATGPPQANSVFMEFSRLVGKNLKQEFYESIDRHSPRLLEIFGSKRGNVGQLLTQISQQTRVGPYTLVSLQFNVVTLTRMLTLEEYNTKRAVHTQRLFKKIYF
ncbi:hypothetical protein PAMA_005559 [Pampus argenteus]